jgi:nucleoside-diphosphate kinase
MASERTFSIIKPNAVKKNVVGAIIQKFEENGLRIAALRMTRLDRSKCEEF